MTDQRNGPLGAVGRFFFSPTDPSTLGFIRVMTGLLLLYVHAAYSFDLQAFLGPHAWLDHEVSNRQRREAPNHVTPLDGKEFVVSVRIEDVPHRREAQMEYFRALPESADARKAKVRYLDTLARQTVPPPEARRPDPFSEGIYLLNSALRLVGDPSEKARLDKALKSDPFDATDSPISYFPEFFRALPPDDRKKVWAELETFLTTFQDAKGEPFDATQTEYVLGWLNGYSAEPPERRGRLFQFLTGELRDDGKDLSLPADPAARGEWIDFARLWGGDPRQVWAKGSPVFSPWLHLTDPAAMWTFHSLCLVVFLLFTLGLWTRVTSVLAWALSLSYIHRSPVILFGQDTMQTILMTYLMIGPSGAAFSLDALRARYRASRALMGGRRAPWAEAVLAGPQPSWLANFAVRMLQVHFCFVYASSGMSKLKGPAWWNHNAAWMTLVNPEFGPIRYSAYEWFIRSLAEYRPVISVVCAIIAAFTLIIELGLPFVVWTKARPAAVTGSILLHSGIAVIMGLCVFSMYMFTMLLCYFPAKLVRARVGVTPGAGRKFVVHYDAHDPAGVRKAAVVRALDLAGQGTYMPDAHGREVALTVDGHRVTGHEMYATALREMPLLRPVKWLGHIPGVWPVVQMVFDR